MDIQNNDANPQYLAYSSLPPMHTQYMDIQSIDGQPTQNILSLNIDDDITIVSVSKKKKKKSKPKITNSLRDPFQIDSKELSVQELRQEIPKTCIVLQPQTVPFGYAISLDMNPANIENIGSNQILQRLPDQILRQEAKVVNPEQMPVLFAELMKQKDFNLPEVLQMDIPLPQPETPIQPQFDSLFKRAEALNQPEQIVNTLMNLAQTVQNTEVQEGQVLIIPQQLGQIVTNQGHLFEEPKLREICQQFLMITFFDLITFEQEKFELRKLIKSSYKQQSCQYILRKLSIVDPEYNYLNVQVLKMIKSLWVWDNVIPYMAQSLYKDCGLVRARLLPQRCNNDSIVLSKYQVFLIMSEMFLGLLPAQVSTYDLPISFGQIMTIGSNDTALVIENKKTKLRCLLHYFSSILREKEQTIKTSEEFVLFQRFRVSLKRSTLFPQDDKGKNRYSNLKLTDHIEPTTVKFGNQYSRETALYLTHENPCRESGQEHFQTSYFMEETYRLMYAKPEIFILKALTPKLDLGEAIIVQGLQQFSNCNWKKQEDSLHGDIDEEWFSHRKFQCGGLYNQQPDIDSYGKRKGTAILIMSKLLFGQTFINNDKIKHDKVLQNYSTETLVIQIQTLYSAFQGRKTTCNQQQRIIISERYIKFIEEDCRWIYFILVWIAASLAKVKVVFEFQKHQHRVEAFLLMRNLNGKTISSIFQELNGFRETLLEAHENMEKKVQQIYKETNHEWNSKGKYSEQLKSQIRRKIQEIRQNLNQSLGNARRASRLTFLSQSKYLFSFVFTCSCLCLQQKISICCLDIDVIQQMNLTTRRLYLAFQYPRVLWWLTL